MLKLALAAFLTTLPALAVEEEVTVDADLATYTCTFQRTFKGAAAETLTATLVISQGACTMTDELQIGTFFAMAQGCTDAVKREVTLLIYPEGPAPRATGTSLDLVKKAVASLDTSADEKLTLTCEK